MIRAKRLRWQHRGCRERFPKGTLICTHIESANRHAPVTKNSQSNGSENCWKIAGGFQRQFKSANTSKVANVMFFSGSEQVKIPLT